MPRTVKDRSAVSGSSAGAPRGRWRLKLYIAGCKGRSLVALANLRLLCAKQLRESEVEVIDLLENPERAKRDDIVAIPTLVRASPGPLRRVLGDLSDSERVLSGLGLTTQ